MKTHKHSKLFASNSGFTRVELSVVVVICIILGVMSSACSNSQQRKMQCISNLKQWGLVWQYNVSDNDGYFSNGSNSTTGDDGEWVASLQKFWSKQDILLCPSATLARSDQGPDYTLKPVEKYRNDSWTAFGSYNTSFKHSGISQEPIPTRASYGNNNWLYNAQTDIEGRSKDWHWRTMNPVGHDLHQIPMFMDMMWRGGGPMKSRMAPPQYNGEWSGYGAEMKHFAMDRHNGGIQGVFMDHSVQHVPIKKLWKLHWHRNWQRDYGDYKSSWPSWMAGYPSANTEPRQLKN